MERVLAVFVCASGPVVLAPICVLEARFLVEFVPGERGVSQANRHHWGGNEKRTVR